MIFFVADHSTSSHNLCEWAGEADLCQHWTRGNEDEREISSVPCFVVSIEIFWFYVVGESEWVDWNQHVNYGQLFLIELWLNKVGVFDPGVEERSLNQLKYSGRSVSKLCYQA